MHYLIKPFDGVEIFLKELQNKKIETGIVTSILTLR